MPSSVRVLTNEESGSCLGRAHEIEAAFRACGLDCRISPLQTGQSLSDLRLLPGTIVVAAGGDGTVNCVASMLAGPAKLSGKDVCMGVLPLGTLNHFAKDLGMPMSLEDAARVIAHGAPRAVDAAEVNGRIFVNNSSLGFYPGMVLERERMKKSGRNKWLSLLIASVRGFLRFRQLSISLMLPPESPGGSPKQIDRVTPFLFVGNNEYALQGAQAGTRASLDGGHLHLALAPGATRWSMFKLTLAVLRRKVHEAENFESFCVPEFTVMVNRRRTCRVSLDGELRRLSGPLHYRILAAALHVIAPGPGPRAAPEQA